MSNVFVIIKMCYVHNQCYDISCATLCILHSTREKTLKTFKINIEILIIRSSHRNGNREGKKSVFNYGKLKTHILHSIPFWGNHAIYEIIWKNMVQPGRPQMTTWHMRITCWITKATNTHSEYVILLALLPQQWLHERASILRRTYFSRLVTMKVQCVFCANGIDCTL